MKRSMTGFWLFVLGWTAAMFAAAWLAPDTATALRLICNVMTLGMALLTHIICLNGSVHWYTGVSFEEAEAAGEVRRAAYARAMRKPFLVIALGMLLLSGCGHLLGWSMWIDFAAATIGTVAAAISTVRIKL
ncbi:MAG: hypothetical protein IKK21_04165 [Clostridia bacterium]|nr:hypothetical protein [Clostridia bacterium]